MAAPTFTGTTLVTAAYRQRLGTVQDRTFTGLLPGVTGAFAQTGPQGPRRIQVTGFLDATGNTKALALKALSQAVQVRQALIGLTGDYDSHDGLTYGECILRAYQQGRVVDISGTADTADYTARMAVVAILEQLDPEDVT